MTTTTATSQPLVAPPPHHHRRAAALPSQSASSQSGQSAATAIAGPAPAAGAAASNSPGAGLQKFASELQSILLNAQSGQPSASGTTADDPATAADPAGAADPTVAAHRGPGLVRNVADRLQELLGGSASAATNQPANLQDVLNKLQQTLQQNLAAYQAAGAQTQAASLTA